MLCASCASACSCSASDAADAAADDPVDLSKAFRTGVMLIPRSIYAFMLILCYVRVLQYLRYFKSVGVLTLVLGHMMKDVFFFMIILFFVSLYFHGSVFWQWFNQTYNVVNNYVNRAGPTVGVPGRLGVNE